MRLPHDLFQHRMKCIGIRVPAILRQVVQKHERLHPENVAREFRSQEHQRPKNEHREEYDQQSSHTFPSSKLASKLTLSISSVETINCEIPWCSNKQLGAWTIPTIIYIHIYPSHTRLKISTPLKIILSRTFTNAAFCVNIATRRRSSLSFYTITQRSTNSRLLRFLRVCVCVLLSMLMQDRYGGAWRRDHRFPEGDEDECQGANEQRNYQPGRNNLTSVFRTRWIVNLWFVTKVHRTISHLKKDQFLFCLWEGLYYRNHLRQIPKVSF